MYELKKIGKVFTSKFVGTGSLSYKKRIYRAAVSQRLRNTDVKNEHFEYYCNFSWNWRKKLDFCKIPCMERETM